MAISVDGGGKAKARQGIIRFVGDWHSAMLFVLSGQMAWVAHAASGAASSTGNSGAASSTGYKGAASSTGNRGAASSTGYSGAATVTGTDGKAMAGPYGCIALAFWKTSANRQEMRCAEIGCGDGSDGKLKAGVWYGLDAEGRFQEIL
ncbi:MAG TPA: hypothetical protein VJ801_15585 [Polyangia bacterium]|nr:hypothetical protein [Polyangia bacterium]